MEGFKLIKTTFENHKEIVGVYFKGEESYYSFLEEVKNVYNIPKDLEIQVYSTDFVVKPHIFVHFVAQYINNLDFVLNIKVVPNAAARSIQTTSKSIETPTKCISTPIQSAITPAQSTPIPAQNILASVQSIITPTTPSTPVQQKYEIPSTMEIKQIPKVKESLHIATLENRHRTTIAKAIISQILTYNPDKRLQREEFLQLAQSITEIFPSEVKDTYYVPFTKGHLAKGKLYDAYNNTRARLSASGVIKRRIKYKSQPTMIMDDSCGFSESEFDENQLAILRSGSCDWDLVLELWRKTHSFRQNEFRNENIETIEYMEKYKVLQHERNYELFEIDFQLLYPEAKGIYEWRAYYQKVMDKAEKIKDNYVKEILIDIENSIEEDSKLALALLLVPYLLPSTRQKTKLNVQEAFISYCKDYVKEEDDDSNDSVKRLKLDDHPRVTLVGDYSKTICFAHVDVYGRRHVFQNPLQAIEVCFQCFMAMNIKYPKLCEHVWLFVQKLIFDISTPEDTIIPSTNTLINDLQQQ